MSIALILGVSLAILGVLLVLAWQLPEVMEQSKKKHRRVAPSVPVKDWQGIAERFEKRVKTMEADTQVFQAQLRDREKYAAELGASMEGLQKQLEQERSWREKEEAVIKKEKKQEKVLKEELVKAREALNAHVADKIRIDAELKDLRRTREELSTAGRSASSRVLVLERQLEGALQELGQLRDENARLNRKKDDTEWVAKSDYRQIETLLKRSRIEVDELKKQLTPEIKGVTTE